MHWVITVLEYHFNKVAGLQPVRLFKKETPAKAFSCKFYEIYQNKFFTNCCHSLSLVSFTITCCYSLSFIVTHWHLLSLFVPLTNICCTTCCQSLSFFVTRWHLLSLFVPPTDISCTTFCQSLSFFVTRCTNRCQSLLLGVSIVCFS